MLRDALQLPPLHLPPIGSLGDTMHVLHGGEHAQSALLGTCVPHIPSRACGLVRGSQEKGLHYQTSAVAYDHVILRLAQTGCARA